MADLDDLRLTEAEREEEEKRRREGKPTLDEEIARKYDARRLAGTVIRGAGRGERLDMGTRSEMERRFPGHDFGGVRVFRGALAEEITSRHKADAVTIANTGMILVRESGRSAPGTTSERALLAHELTHVAQAQKGMHFARENGHGDGEHEVEAEAMERQVGGGEDGSDQAGKENVKAKDEFRRRKIMERVLEIMAEKRRLAQERSGGY